MSYIIVEKSKIIKFQIPKTFDAKLINVGIPIKNDENNVLGLKSVGDTVLPSPDFGNVCKKNANGYSITDKSQPKKERYVSTVWIQPFGNDYASPVAADIYRKCYPKIDVPPTEIEISLVEDNEKNRYLIANLTTQNRKEHIKEAINIFLEIFGLCYIYSDNVEKDNNVKRQHCNWEILPPGEKPSEHLRSQLSKRGERTDTFDISRLETLDKYKVEKVVEGISGFMGYYAYIFSKYCVLESAIYGNATYIIPKEEWEVLSQKTKQELIDEKFVIEKIIHRESWYANIRKIMRKLENQ